jgi:ABC-2 type transport system ATP-binding protein
MELRLAHPSDGAHRDGAVKLVSGLVRVEARGENWLRYFTSNPQETNPLVLQTLASHEVGVVTLSVVPRSLEDVYLRVVEE